MFRSVGRGLSHLMARIHEQEECGGPSLESTQEPFLRNLGPRCDHILADPWVAVVGMSPVVPGTLAFQKQCNAWPGARHATSLNVYLAVVWKPSWLASNRKTRRTTIPAKELCPYQPPPRSGAGEIFRIQELSDCDDDGLGAVLATSRPTASPPTFPATVLSPVAAAAPVGMNVGHQRAALELRNLTLEREASVRVCACKEWCAETRRGQTLDFDHRCERFAVACRLKMLV